MKLDRILGIGAILLAIPVGVASWGFGLGIPKSPGAGFWPLLIVLAMAGLGLSLILRPTADGQGDKGPSRWGKFVISLGTLVFYVVALEPLGYLLTTASLLFAQFRWVEGRSAKTSGAIAVLAAASSLLLFRVLLKVTLPEGVIPLPRGW